MVKAGSPLVGSDPSNPGHGERSLGWSAGQRSRTPRIRHQAIPPPRSLSSSAGSSGSRISSFSMSARSTRRPGRRPSSGSVEGVSRFVSSTPSHDSARRAAWLHAGASEFVDRNDPFDQLLLTITRLLRVCPSPRPERRSPASLASMRAGPHAHDSQLERFATLTDREQFVLAELLEGHCAEEIAKTAYVSISTVRSQIKSILQKLGVNSQLAAVALARRAGWTLNRRRLTDPKPANVRRSRAS